MTIPLAPMNGLPMNPITLTPPPLLTFVVVSLLLALAERRWPWDR